MQDVARGHRLEDLGGTTEAYGEAAGAIEVDAERLQGEVDLGHAAGALAVHPDDAADLECHQGTQPIDLAPDLGGVRDRPEQPQVLGQLGEAGRAVIEPFEGAHYLGVEALGFEPWSTRRAQQFQASLPAAGAGQMLVRQVEQRSGALGLAVRFEGPRHLGEEGDLLGLRLEPH